jgi:predicted branched-subunit amino acid permease
VATGDVFLTFERAGIVAGFRTCLPVAVGVGGYGIAFGVLARQAGLSVSEATLMSGLVPAGASQLIAVELWDAPLPVLAIVVTTLVVNVRYVLMSAAFSPGSKNYLHRARTRACSSSRTRAGRSPSRTSGRSRP